MSQNQTPVPFIDLRAQHATIRTEVMEAVSRVFENQSFVLGEEVSSFEADAAEYCDADHAIGCASGTDALLLALMACGVGPGDEVITSPFTFFATAGSIHRVGATPVFVDIEPDGFNIDPDAIEDAITDRTKAIMPVHIFGQVAEMDPIWRIAAKHDLHIIEDAAQSIGAEYRGRRSGVLGTIACFSFFPTKNLGGAGDGGMMTTDDDEVAARLSRLRVHGDVGGYEHLEVGLNSRLDALQAAVLKVKLRHLDDWTEARRANAERYDDLLADYRVADAIVPPVRLPERRHVYNQYVTRVPGGRREGVLSKMRAAGVGAAVYYPKPLHLQTCFADLGYKRGQLPVAEQACDEVMALPIFAELGEERQEIVVQTLCKSLGRQAVPSRPRVMRAAA
ncbi:DegT/DnrJ/EryC1/StrS family aminotransferase [Alienimonas chondri]|uniref:UDP-2-acetamido-2-deoxy-3-oxo-D-glucuronate aminotransferase n=1 Tax=Alienimonas chondri TaxID=2681879 RepID=A0ABX1VBX2_9PLAN|nr:DegT/DnrJ/EryC1/StrS family aminotransferase [Alienimonas chondri]NNJ25233.1 UDP-2-acetamido-2-deoxy-3-oxo-D-glucuronate aminotransferase [Alienimonas chondri]